MEHDLNGRPRSSQRGLCRSQEAPRRSVRALQHPAFDAGAPEVVAGSSIGSSKKAVQPNDVMISRIVPHIRRACVVGPTNRHRQIASGEWIIFRDERIWPSYLRWLLVGDVFHSAFMRTVSGVGGVAPQGQTCRGVQDRGSPSSLASRSGLRRFWDAADALRANRREALAELDTLVQSTFFDMFGDPVANPKGWEVRRVETKRSQGFRSAHLIAPSPKKTTSSMVFLWLIRCTSSPERFASVMNRRSLRRSCDSQATIDFKPATWSWGGAERWVDVPSSLTPRRECSAVRVTFYSSSPGRTFVTLLGEHILQRVDEAPPRGPLAGGHNAEPQSNDDRRTQGWTPPLDLQHRYAAIVEAIEQQKVTQRAHLTELDTLFASLQSRAFRGDL